MGALDAAVRSGKALYAGISSYSADRTREAARILQELGTPLLIHQPSYSMLNRWIEEDLLDAVGELGSRRDRVLTAGAGRAHRPVPERRTGRTPARRRASRSAPDMLTEETLKHVRALNEIAKERGQSVAQLALAWTLRDDRVTSALIGASSVAQLEDNLAAVQNLKFSAGGAGRHRRRRRRGRHQPLEEELRRLTAVLSPHRRSAPQCALRRCSSVTERGAVVAALGDGPTRSMTPLSRYLYGTPMPHEDEQT